MNLSKIIILSCILTGAIIQSAAYSSCLIEKPTASQPSDLPDIVRATVGFKCGKHGAAAIITSLTEDDAPSCSITIAYSEHPALKDAQKLQSIAEKIEILKKNYNCKDLHDLCTKEATMHAALSLTESHSDDFVQVSKRPAYNLIALCITLESQCLQHNGCVQEPEELFSGSANLWQEDISGNLFKSAHATHHILIRSSDPVKNPQEAAEQACGEHPDCPFNLVINLETWRQFVTPYHVAAQQKIEQIAAAKQKIKERKNKHCTLQ